MRRRPLVTKSAGLVVAMLLVMAAAVLGQRMIASRAFNSLESSTVGGDAHRVAVALSYETKLLRGFGATNSIWDDSYDAVTTRDAAAFLADFPPADLHSIGDVDAAVGIDRKGIVHTGGLTEGDRFVDLPDGLTPERLKTMVAFDAEAGTGRCGLAVASDVPYLYCGFPTRRGDGSGTAGSGLVFFRALDDAAVAQLAKSTGIALRLAPDAVQGRTGVQTLHTELGALRTTTSITGSDTLDLTMSLPALGGERVLIRSPHHRPIHATDTKTADETFLLMGGCLLVLLLLVHLLVLRSLRNQVEPLRTTTERIIESGDHEVRLDASGKGEVAALGQTINVLLDSIAGQAAEVERNQQEREQRIVDAHVQQQRTEQQSREHAQERVDATVEAVVAELSTVLDQATRVREAAGDIAARSTATDEMTSDVLVVTSAANEALAELNDTLAQVYGIVGIIRSITEQTRMLALNANIEAARAGELGAGFRVVAHEVRSLAADTATSADEIATTTGLVTSTAQRVGRTLEDVTSRVAAVGTATQEVREVVSDQTATVEALTDAVRQAVDRVQAMANLSEDLERRRHPRHPVFGTANLRVDATVHRVSLRDLSEGGLEIGLPDNLTLSSGQSGRLHLPADLGGIEIDVHVVWLALGGRNRRVGVEVDRPYPELGELSRSLHARYAD